MGRKVHPLGFRLGVNQDWQSRWFSERGYTEQVQEDIKLRAMVGKRLPNASISRVIIERSAANQIEVTLFTAKPGIVIGKGGQAVEILRKELEDTSGKKVKLNINEIKQPELDAYLVAESIADQITRRVSHKRAMKQAVQRAMRLGAKGIRIKCAGRLAGAEMARVVQERDGRVPLHTIRADIDYGQVHAHTTYGRVGVKVWIYRGDVIPGREETLQSGPAEGFRRDGGDGGRREGRRDGGPRPGGEQRQGGEQPRGPRREGAPQAPQGAPQGGPRREGGPRPAAPQQADATQPERTPVAGDRPTQNEVSVPVASSDATIQSSPTIAPSVVAAAPIETKIREAAPAGDQIVEQVSAMADTAPEGGEAEAGDTATAQAGAAEAAPESAEALAFDAGVAGTDEVGTAPQGAEAQAGDAFVEPADAEAGETATAQAGAAEAAPESGEARMADAGVAGTDEVGTAPQGAEAQAADAAPEGGEAEAGESATARAGTAEAAPESGEASAESGAEDTQEKPGGLLGLIQQAGTAIKEGVEQLHIPERVGGGLETVREGVGGGLETVREGVTGLLNREEAGEDQAGADAGSDDSQPSAEADSGAEAQSQRGDQQNEEER